MLLLFSYNMSFITVERTNPDKIAKRLNGWSQIIGSNVIIEKIEDRMIDTYKQIHAASPYRTGFLRSTIGVNSGKDFAQISVGAFYAVYVDQGSQGRMANPFWSNHIAGLSMQVIIDVIEVFRSRW